MNIDNDQRQNHFLGINLIKSTEPLNEVCWWVHMRAPLANVTKNFRKKSGSHRAGPLIVPVDGLARFIWESWPSRDTRLKCMGEIDKFLCDESLLNFPER